MVASREASKVEQANHLWREREVAIPLDQTGQEGGYSSDPALMVTIKQLPSYLQPVGMLMANMVAPGEEVKLLEKRGFNALYHATSMMLAVSVIFLRKFFKCCIYFLSSLFPSVKRYSGHLGLPRLPKAPLAIS